MRRGFVALIGCIVLIAPTLVNAELIIDTGVPGQSEQRSSVRNFGTGAEWYPAWRAGKFELADPYFLTGFSAWTAVQTQGRIRWAIYADDSANPPGNLTSGDLGTLLWSIESQSPAATNNPTWVGVDGFTVKLAAGTYWLALEIPIGELTWLLRPIGNPPLSGAVDTRPPNPLAAEAGTFAGQPWPNIAWSLSGSRYGYRIYGDLVNASGDCNSPVACARQAIGAPWKISLKGWDKEEARWVQPLEVIQSAYVDKWGTGPGIDCSGLIEWSRGLAWKQGWRARASYELCSNNQSEPVVPPSSRQAGDIMCFDYCGPGETECTPRDGLVDHVSLYAGASASGSETFIESVFGFKASAVAEFPLSDLTGPTRKTAFLGTDAMPCPDCGYRRLRENAIPAEVQFVSQSPITLRVTDPDDISIDHTTRFNTVEESAIAVPHVLYYSFVNGEHDMVYAPRAKTGAYLVRALPKDEALPGDTYSLVAVVKGAEFILANEIAVGSIPKEGYGVEVSGDTAAPFVPLLMQLRPGSINGSVDGVLPVVVYSTETFRAGNLAVGSLAFGPGGAPEAHQKLHLQDMNGDGLLDAVLHFRISAARLPVGESRAELRGALTGGSQVLGWETVVVR